MIRWNETIWSTLIVLGFPPCFIHLVMQCVRTASFSILIDGSPKGPIVPSRGLRQGDPLSPYLFIICTEGLVSLLEKSALNGSLRGICICRGAPIINHLLFVDDSFIFCKANKAYSDALLSILHTYAHASGQCINIEKTKMVFSKNVKEEIRNEIMSLWGTRGTQKYERYLRLHLTLEDQKEKYSWK